MGNVVQTANSVNDLVDTVKEQLVPVVGSFIRQLQVSQLRIRKSTEQVETDLSRTILTINSQSDQTAKSLTAAIDRITAAVDNVDQNIIATMISVSGYINVLLPVSIFSICIIAALIIEKYSGESEFRLVYKMAADCLAAAGFVCLFNFLIMMPFDSYNLVLLAAFSAFVTFRWAVRKRDLIVAAYHQRVSRRRKTGGAAEYVVENVDNDLKMKIQAIS